MTEMDAKGGLAFIRTQVCEWFENYIPSKAWGLLRQEGVDLNFLTRLLATICAGIHLWRPSQTTAAGIVSILNWVGQLQSKEEHIIALHEFKAQLHGMQKVNRAPRELPSFYPERPSKFAQEYPKIHKEIMMKIRKSYFLRNRIG